MLKALQKFLFVFEIGAGEKFDQNKSAESKLIKPALNLKYKPLNVFTLRKEVILSFQSMRDVQVKKSFTGS